MGTCTSKKPNYGITPINQPTSNLYVSQNSSNQLHPRSLPPSIPITPAMTIASRRTQFSSEPYKLGFLENRNARDTRMAFDLSVLDTNVRQPASPYSPDPRNIDVEKYVIVNCPHTNANKSDVIVVVDVDPESATYMKIISLLELPTVGDEIHRSGWTSRILREPLQIVERTHLVLPCLNSSRIYVINVENINRLKIVKCIGPDELSQNGVSFPHSVKCLPDGSIAVSTLGDRRGVAQGNFLQLDRRTFNIRENFAQGEENYSHFNGDFALQPRKNIMIGTEWGHPNNIRDGFLIEDVENAKYGCHLNIWNLQSKQLQQTIELDPFDGCMSLAIRFLHNPDCNHAFASSAIGSAIYHIYMDSVHGLLDRLAIYTTGRYLAQKVIQLTPRKVENWMLKDMPAMITDLIISFDDRYLYFSSWLHGHISQYDISDPFHPTLTGQIYIGGCLLNENVIEQKRDNLPQFRPQKRTINGVSAHGAPNMLQLSLDGRRLYVTNSFYRKWDEQFYPNLIEFGSVMLQLKIGANGGLILNEEFMVNFGAANLPNGPYLAREMRFPNGDCTSDSYM